MRFLSSLLGIFLLANPSLAGFDDVANCLWNFRFRLTYSLGGGRTGEMTAWSNGGGYWSAIPIDPILHPFAGRIYGGGFRKEIYGSRAYGSGYPYGVDAIDTVRGRPFPFGSWPISWGGDYAGSDEYAMRSTEPMRPGGRQARAQIEIDDRWAESDPSAIFHLVGDLDSVVSMMGLLVNQCVVKPNWAQPLVHGKEDSIRPENVIQYYRASSFALAHRGYNNTFAFAPHNFSTQLTHDESIPLDVSLPVSIVLQCLNDTIGRGLPIMDELGTLTTNLGIFVGAGAAGLTFTIFLCIGRLKLNKL